MRHVSDSSCFTPGGDRELNVKHSWRNPAKNKYEPTASWETNAVKNSQLNPPEPPRSNELFGEDSKDFFGRQKPFCKEPKKTKTPFCPKTFTMAEDPEASAVERIA